ncbi:MAG: hypothetical protein II865_00785 [Bacteroidales bacterium]|nr:hypothetical protein [Bacteroidales bacterium]
MKQNLLVELLEDGSKVSFYSPRFDGEEYTEFEKFLLESSLQSMAQNYWDHCLLL